MSLMENKIIEVKKVVKTYKTGDTTITALTETTESFDLGKVTLIMGPSGSGKTTLLSMIGCVIYPTSGAVFFDGEEVSKYSEKQLAGVRLHKIGFIFQQFNLIEPLTALENVMQPLLLMGVSKSVALERSKIALEKVGLGNRFKNLPKKLSGGQKQRVAIARALVTNPQIVLCDEPTASLDSKSAVMVMEELKGLAADGKAVIIVSHDLRLRKYADRIIYVEEGVVSNTISNEDDYK